MTDFEAKKGQFAGWDEAKQRRPLMAALMREITTRPLILIGAAMTVASFGKINWTAYPEFEPFEDIYHLVMFDALRTAISLSSDSHPNAAPFNGESIGVVVAKQLEFGASPDGGIADGYIRATAALAADGKLTGAATFGDPAHFPQLQAADIAAFELRWKITRPDLSRFPWAALEETGRVSLYLRDIDVTGTFPSYPRDGRTGDDVLILKLKSDRKVKAIANQGKRSRKRETR